MRTTRRRTEAGFTLVEMAIVALVMGILLAIGAIGFGHFNEGMALRGATEDIANRIRLTRDRAMATRTSQTMRFEAGYQGTDYRVETGGSVQAGWTLPGRISYAWNAGTIHAVTLTPDGHCDASGMIILQDTRGVCDTVGVLSSGLILTQ